jgi:Lipocalin-like domain
MNRRHILSLSLTTAVGLGLLSGTALAQQKSLKQQLTGAWTLVSLDNVLPDGKKQQLFGPNPVGTLIFDASGRFAQMQVTANRPKFKSANRLEITPEEGKAAAMSTLAQFGTWSVSEADKTITMRNEGALMPNSESVSSAP